MPSCRVAPLIDTLTLSPAPAEELDELGDDEDVAGDVLDAESDGSADAAHGVAASPTPMPRATANAPMRPMLLALLMVVPCRPRRRWTRELLLAMSTELETGKTVRT